MLAKFPQIQNSFKPVILFRILKRLYKLFFNIFILYFGESHLKSENLKICIDKISIVIIYLLPDCVTKKFWICMWVGYLLKIDLLGILDWWIPCSYELESLLNRDRFETLLNSCILGAGKKYQSFEPELKVSNCDSLAKFQTKK